MDLFFFNALGLQRVARWGCHPCHPRAASEALLGGRGRSTGGGRRMRCPRVQGAAWSARAQRRPPALGFSSRGPGVVYPGGM